MAAEQIAFSHSLCYTLLQIELFSLFATNFEKSIRGHS